MNPNDTLNPVEARSTSSGGLRAWIDSFSGLVLALGKATWVILFIVGLLAVARFVGAWQTPVSTPSSEPRNVSLPASIPWDQVSGEVADALRAASAEAERVAEAGLEEWMGELREGTEPFLDWYFNYWQQTAQGFRAIGYIVENALRRRMGRDTRPVEERIAKDIAREFTLHVIRPRNAGLRLERITRDAMAAYGATLDRGLADISTRYRIPEADWNRLINDIAWTTSQTRGDRDISLSVKALAATPAVLAGTAMAGRASHAIQQMAGRQVASGATKTAARAGTKKAATLTTKKIFWKLIPIIIVWDIWDHHQTREKNLPLLRDALHGYLGEMKHHLLHDTEEGILTVVNGVTAEAIAAVSESRGPKL